MFTRVSVLQINHNRPAALQRLATRFEMHHVSGETLASSFPVTPGIRAIATGVPPVPVGSALINALPDLEIIANFGVGYDAIDLPAAIRRGVVITNTPGVVDEEVADLTMGLLLATVRRLPQAYNFAMSGQWGKAEFPMSPSLRGRKIGLVGMGRIGQAIARRCGAFGLPVLYHARSQRPDSQYPYFSRVVDMAAVVDVLIAVTPGGEETRGLIGADVLQALGPQGVFINVGRGSVVDEPALIRALETGQILAAGLDVLANEPQIPEGLRWRDNVVVLPHVGGATDDTRDRIGDLVVRNLFSWFDGKGPVTPVPETPFYNAERA